MSRHPPPQKLPEGVTFLVTCWDLETGVFTTKELHATAEQMTRWLEKERITYPAAYAGTSYPRLEGIKP